MQVLVGFGANLGSAPDAFTRAVIGLDRRHRVLRRSALYRSIPMGGPRQPRYLNAAVVVECASDLERLLDQCRALETAAGRDRAVEEHWGPRPLDLDLLLAEDAVHRGPRLVIPHPGFHQRAFALVPAAELVPGWEHPMLGRTVAELAEEVVAIDPGAVEVVAGAEGWGKSTVER
jgi:2-amino-4-hydroxy-6-hydroxymethyldihydropteridine diphosphokinase